MADKKRPEEADSSENGTSVFDLFEPPPEPDPNSFGKIPVIKDNEIDLTDSSVEVKAAADAEAAGLQHWTAPPTGQVPAVLANERESAGMWGDVAGPSWHGEDPSWDGPDLADVFADTESVSFDADVVDLEDEDDEGDYNDSFDSVAVQRPATAAPNGSAPANGTRPPAQGTRPPVNGTRPPASSGQPPAQTGSRAVGSDAPHATPPVNRPQAPSRQPAPPPARTRPAAQAQSPQGPSSPGQSPPAQRPPAQHEARPPRPVDQDQMVTAPPADPRRATARPAPASSAAQAPPSIDDIRFATGETDLPRSGRHGTARTEVSDRIPLRDEASFTPPRVRPGRDDHDELDDEALGLSRPGGRNIPQAIGVGLALAAVVVAAMYFGPYTTMLVIVVMALLAVLELYNAMRMAGLRPATLLGIVGTVAAPAAAYYRGDAAFPLIVALAVVFGTLWYLVGADTERPVLNLSLTMMGIFWVGGLAAFAALMVRQDLGIQLLLATIIITVVSDTMAYIGGRAYGSRPFHHASPNKTWEGTISGFIGSVFAGFAIGITEFGTLWDGHLVPAMALGAVVGVLAPMGDLAESVVKRDLGVKDMGTLLPGHGGVMDRLDGLLFALPGAFYLAMVYNLL